MLMWACNTFACNDIFAEKYFYSIQDLVNEYESWLGEKLPHLFLKETLFK